jgi:hypothetical protein
MPPQNEEYRNLDSKGVLLKMKVVESNAAIRFTFLVVSRFLGIGEIGTLREKEPLGHVRLISFLGLVCAALFFLYLLAF